MDWTQLQPLWDWLLPAGWLATALAWWRDRRVRRVREVKETESTYKSLYDDLSTTVVDLSRQLRRINEKTINYETAIRKCHACKYVEPLSCCHLPAPAAEGQAGQPSARTASL